MFDEVFTEISFEQFVLIVILVPQQLRLSGVVMITTAMAASP